MPRRIADRVLGNLFTRREKPANRLVTAQMTLIQFADTINECSEIMRSHIGVIQQLSQTTRDLKHVITEYNNTQKHLIELLEPTIIVRQDKHPEYQESRLKAPTEETKNYVGRNTSAPSGCYFSIRW